MADAERTIIIPHTGTDGYSVVTELPPRRISKWEPPVSTTGLVSIKYELGDELKAAEMRIYSDEQRLRSGFLSQYFYEVTWPTDHDQDAAIDFFEPLFEMLAAAKKTSDSKEVARQGDIDTGWNYWKAIAEHHDYDFHLDLGWFVYGAASKWFDLIYMAPRPDEWESDNVPPSDITLYSDTSLRSPVLQEWMAATISAGATDKVGDILGQFDDAFTHFIGTSATRSLPQLLAIED
ncbi:MAG TPA: hypothetical protein VHB51_03755 [Candidatus Saccharimonadales bacterium]|nr:hypothetical protein [Candidatus Saccharimonadales bacterium]